MTDIFNLEHITTTEEAVVFAHNLFFALRLAFDVDTPFTEYVNHITHKPTFTREECERGDRLRGEFVAVCEAAGLDAYEVANRAREAFLRAEGIIK